jgi:hypothetical protein
MQRAARNVTSVNVHPARCSHAGTTQSRPAPRAGTSPRVSGLLVLPPTPTPTHLHPPRSRHKVLPRTVVRLVALSAYRGCCSSSSANLRTDASAPRGFSTPPVPSTVTPHLRRNWAHPSYIRTGTGRTAAISKPGLGSPLRHPHRGWARPCHICSGTWLGPATSAPGLGSALPHLLRNWAHPDPHPHRG